MSAHDAITPSTEQEEKLDFKRILPIFMIVLVDLMGLTIILPALTHYAASFGASPLMIGLLMAAYPVMQLFGGPLLGGLSDRFGRKPVLVISQFGTFFGFILMGFANTMGLLFIARLIDGLSGGNIVAAQAAIADSTTEKTRTAGLGLIGAAFGLGFTMGPAIGGIALALTDNNYAVPAFIAAGFSLVSILLTMFWFEETLTEDVRKAREEGIKSDHPRRGFIFAQFSNIARGLRNPLVGALLMLMFFQHFIFATFEQFLPLFDLSRLGLNASENTPLFLLIGVIVVIIQAKYIGDWSRKFGEHRLIYGALGLMAAGMLLISLTPEQARAGYDREALLADLERNGSTEIVQIEVDVPDGSNTGWLGVIWLVIAVIPTSIGGALIRPSINSLITRRVEPEEVGVMLGVSMALISAANALMPIVNGVLIQLFGVGAPFMIGGVAMAALLVFALQRITPRPGELPDHQPEPSAVPEGAD